MGYVIEKLGSSQIEVLLISRRQHLRTAARMNVRGLDEEGNAANFVETE